VASADWGAEKINTIVMNYVGFDELSWLSGYLNILRNKYFLILSNQE
jgi:hypothetical protein